MYVHTTVVHSAHVTLSCLPQHYIRTVAVNDCHIILYNVSAQAQDVDDRNLYRARIRARLSDITLKQ